GSVTFQDGTAVLQTIPLDRTGTATFTAATLSPGTHAITAVYNGDGNFSPRMSAILSQSATASSNEAYVTALYQDVLERPPDAPHFAIWVQLLNTGTLRATVAFDFVTSAENYGREVDTFYWTFLKRSADAPGRAAWVSALINGMSEGAVAVAFLTSA